MGSQPQKFFFNENFDLNPKDTEKQNPFYVKGYSVGLELGIRQGEASVREAIEYKLAENMKTIVANLTQLHDQRRDYFEKLEEETVNLTRLMATKMLSAVRQDDCLEEIVNLVRQSLQDVREGTCFVLKLPVGYKEIFTQYLDRVPQDSFSSHSINLVEDGSLGPHDCEFHWKDGFASLEGSSFRHKVNTIFHLSSEIEVQEKAE